MADIHVSTTGSDTGSGAEGQPFRTVAKALSAQQNGDRVILEAGEYVETAPLVVQSVEQARLICPDRGEAILEPSSFVLAPASTVAGSLLVRNCPHYVIDGVIVRPPATQGALANPVTACGILVQESPGALLTDVRIDSWTVSLGANSQARGIYLLGSQHARAIRCSVTNVLANCTGVGELVGIALRGGSGQVDQSSVANLTAVNGSVYGYQADSTSAAGTSVRFERSFAQNLSNPDFPVAGFAFLQSGEAYDMVVRDCQAVNIMPTGSVCWGLYLNGGGLADVRGFIAFRCFQGITSFDVAFGSRLDRLTLHQCDTGIQSTSPNPPAKITVRNASFSMLRRAMVVEGLPGSTFFDADFLNFFEVEDPNSPGSPAWYVAADPLASSFDIGDHVYEFRPLYVSADLDGTDFEPEVVSQLINRGGDF